jgi:hypothetical protein
MAAATGPKFSASIKPDLARATLDVSKVLQRLKNPDFVATSEFNEGLCAAAGKVSKLHGRIVEYAEAAARALEEKCEAVQNLGHQEAYYQEACGELEDFVGWFDETVAKQVVVGGSGFGPCVVGCCW